MKKNNRCILAVGLLALAAPLASLHAQSAAAPAAGPYKVLRTAKTGGDGSFDYVYADSAGRRLYIPRTGQSPRLTVFDLDTLESVGTIPDVSARGTAIDTASGHGFISSKPVVMFDTKTLAILKKIDVQGNPDGILFDPFNERVWVLSHAAPNATVINGKDGTVIGTVDLGGQPEQAATDGKGHIYINLEDMGQIAAVDAATMKVTAHYDLGSKDAAPSGLGFDAKNHILFAFGGDQKAVILNSDTGKVITTLPIGAGVDGGSFNPNTMEAFASNGRDGTLTVIKENSPTSFVVEQNVPTRAGSKTHSLDTKTNQIYLITADRVGTGRGAQILPDSFSILVVGK